MSQGGLRARTGLATLSSCGVSLERPWGSDLSGFALGDVSPTSDPGRVPRPLTLGLISLPLLSAPASGLLLGYL